MKFKGKVALWFWLVMVLGEAIVTMALLTAEEDLLIGIGIYNQSFLLE